MRLTRFGVLGDVHTEDVALGAALDHLDGLGLDAVLCVGDIVDGPGDADRTCALLRARGVLAVRGNHDRWFLGSGSSMPDATIQMEPEHREWLASLPTTRRFETPLGGALLCHGVGTDDMAVLKRDTDHHSLRWMDAFHAVVADPTVSLMIGGHTHERMVRGFDGLIVINAGTLLRDHEPGFVVVDLALREVSAFDLSSDARVRSAGTLRL